MELPFVGDSYLDGVCSVLFNGASIEECGCVTHCLRLGLGLWLWTLINLQEICRIGGTNMLKFADICH